jgi:hypothetical protein
MADISTLVSTSTRVSCAQRAGDGAVRPRTVNLDMTNVSSGSKSIYARSIHIDLLYNFCSSGKFKFRARAQKKVKPTILFRKNRKIQICFATCLSFEATHI